MPNTESKGVHVYPVSLCVGCFLVLKERDGSSAHSASWVLWEEGLYDVASEMGVCIYICTCSLHMHWKQIKVSYNSSLLSLSLQKRLVLYASEIVTYKFTSYSTSDSTANCWYWQVTDQSESYLIHLFTVDSLFFNQSESYYTFSLLLSQSVSYYTFFTVYMYKKNMLQHYLAFISLLLMCLNMDCDIVIWLNYR